MPHQPAPLPADEQARLEELYRLGILDTAAEDRFDRITQFVADLFDVPTAFISFIDRNRQWIKSACNPPFAQTKRDVSFCAYTILQTELLIIPDATTDPRFADNPLVVGPPYIRFYAGATLRGPNGRAIGTLCLIDRAPRNISTREQKRLQVMARMVEQELQYEYRFQEVRKQAYRNAHYDAATGLPSPNLFLDRVNQTIHLARRGAHSLLVAVVELRPMQELLAIVDKEVGEHLLYACGERLTTRLNPACTVARWRGEQFAVLLPTLTQPFEGEAFLQLLRSAFFEPIRQEGRVFQFEALCGASAYPEAGIDADMLIAGAQLALRECQQTPHMPFRLYSPETSHAMTRRFNIEGNLRTALQQNVLSVAYQPIVNIERGAIQGVEALCRWEDPAIGTVTTDEFIRQAEESKLILEIDRFSLSQAAKQVRYWDAKYAQPLTLSVNISGKTLLQDDFVKWLQMATLDSDLSPTHVVLEITENYLVRDIEQARRNIEAARALGFRFAIDDFGTGFSSFDYLTKLPIDQLKLDRVFVHEMTERDADASIAHTIIALAREMALPLLAEGIETYEQLLYLKAYKCKGGQGYYFSRPVAAERIEQMLANQTPLQ